MSVTARFIGGPVHGASTTISVVTAWFMVPVRREHIAASWDPNPSEIYDAARYKLRLGLELNDDERVYVHVP